MSQMLRKFSINDFFWNYYERLVTEEVIPYQEKALRDEIPGAEKSGAMENFRLAAQMLETGSCDGEFYGMVFQDSDVAKWIEAASYSLVLKPDRELEKRIDEIIVLIGKAQDKDGYLDTCFTIKDVQKRWTNLQEAHELYCAGHMIEAAVAYHEATGKDSLLNIMKRTADHIYKRFITENTEGYPGHPEIELALMRLYRATKEERYLELAAHFINVRGKDADYYRREAERRGWTVWGNDPEDTENEQCHAPVRMQTKAVGHAVRAVYLMTGMADLASETKEEALKKACRILWKNIVQKRMYVTGGIGSTGLGEAFTKDYDLPNETAYSETCASIGLIFFANKLLALETDGEYADVMERALYNCVLAGMQLDGKRFFYVNPLEVIPGISGEAVTHKHVLPERPKWFGCACCPPNVARLLTSLSEYAWRETEDTLYSNLYIGGRLDLRETKGICLCVESGYPYEGRIVYTLEEVQENREFTFAVRIPGWCSRAAVRFQGRVLYEKEETGQRSTEGSRVEKGYLYLTKQFQKGDQIELELDMTPVKVYANPLVAADSGKIALMRGPLVYCAEGADNEKDVLGLTVCQDAPIQVCSYDANLLSGIVMLQIEGTRTKKGEELYTKTPPQKEKVMIQAIPYYTWGNRGLNEMRVWLPER